MQRILALTLLWMVLSGCTAHKIEIQQGNILSQERLALVKPGMEQQQVRFALGSPLVQDPFHPERWDYFYRLNEEGKDKLTYRATLYFNQNRFVRMEKQGPIPPTEQAALQQLARKQTRYKK